MIYQVVIKSSYNHSMIFVIVLAPKCETFPDHWVWNWYNISAVYFRKSKEEVYNILKQKKQWLSMIHTNLQYQWTTESWELTYCHQSISIENAEDVKSSSKSQKYCWSIEKKQKRSLHFTKLQSWSFTVA